MPHAAAFCKDDGGLGVDNEGESCLYLRYIDVYTSKKGRQYEQYNNGG